MPSIRSVVVFLDELVCLPAHASHRYVLAFALMPTKLFGPLVASLTPQS